MRTRAIVLTVARACDRYIEWCDYLTDAQWHRWGVVLHPPFVLCERFNQYVVTKYGTGWE